MVVPTKFPRSDRDIDIAAAPAMAADPNHLLGRKLKRSGEGDARIQEVLTLLLDSHWVLGGTPHPCNPTMSEEEAWSALA